MFTGIVETLGKLSRIERRGDGLLVLVEVDGRFAGSLERGASVMVSGACLTVTGLADASFTADVSAETLRCTNIGEWGEGEAVNLERALRLGGPIDGHLVSGHVDAVGRVNARTPGAAGTRFEIEAPAELAPLIARKGSICVDGVSLTVNAVSGRTFNVNIIPYTIENTTFSGRKPGDAVHLEADLVARYLQRCLECRD